MRFLVLVLGALLVCGTGCGGFMARRIAQAPNSYPKWLVPEAPVSLEFSAKVLTAFTNQTLEVKNPEATLHYWVVEPANYEFRWTNRVEEADGKLTLKFSAKVDNLESRTNRWTANPRGTALLVHGYGVARFAMLPWALLLGQEGWRCVLVDMRGHGQSSGDRVFFGTVESRDLSLLLDELKRNARLAQPLSVLADSLGAVVSLRLKLEDQRVTQVVAMSPYADLGSAIQNIADEYANWMPDWWIKAGVGKLPELLGVRKSELNPAHWFAQTNAPGVLFVAGGNDRIAPVDEVKRLRELAGTERSGFMVVPNATHEALPFMFDDLAGPVLQWLGKDRKILDPAATSAELSHEASTNSSRSAGRRFLAN